MGRILGLYAELLGARGLPVPAGLSGEPATG